MIMVSPAPGKYDLVGLCLGLKVQKGCHGETYDFVGLYANSGKHFNALSFSLAYFTEKKYSNNLQHWDIIDWCYPRTIVQ